jgi:hypothetical protein
MRIDALTLDGSAAFSPSHHIRSTYGVTGLVHHGRKFEGLELYVILVEAELEGGLDLLCNAEEASLACLFALTGHASVGVLRLDAGFGWHSYRSRRDRSGSCRHH